MTIINFKEILDSDLRKFTWRALERFLDVDEVTSRIINRFTLQGKQKENAKRQATEIRYCLLQAREYFHAFENTSLAVQPVLLYYCLTSLATAEILFKQAGNSNLQRAREAYGHHGLDFIEPAKPSRSIVDELDGLKARPKKRGADAFGAFELWRQSAQHLPVVGKSIKTFDHGGETSGFACLSPPSNKIGEFQIDQLVTLDQCFSHIPKMPLVLQTFDIIPKSIRGAITRRVTPDGNASVNILTHPGPPGMSDAILDQIRVAPEIQRKPRIIQYERSFSWTFAFEKDDQVSIFFPEAFNENAQTVFFFASPCFLNEFGFHYISLFILSNYARYYQDFWMKHIEKSWPFSQVIRYYLDLAATRVPLLSLSELTETYHLPA